MSWLGELLGEIAGSLFPGARAIVTKAVDRAVDAVVSAGKRFVASWVERAADDGSSSTSASAKAQRSQAEELAEEEKYLAEKFKRDGFRSPSDADRVQEIFEARNELREKMGETNAVKSAQDISATDSLISTNASPDELASQVGILSTKQCNCGGIMTLQLGPYNIKTGQRFFWRCTAARPIPCQDIYVTPTELALQVSVRQPHADLDISPAERKAWDNPSLLAKTAGRVRRHLGDEDEAIICPIHLLPMKLLPTANSDGLLLDSYQYTCLGVHPDGRACNHTVPVKSFGQVSGLLTRSEGRGIL